MVGSRGFESRSARSERAASANCATSRYGPSGWTRTTTSRVKSPACCVDTTEGVELTPGIEPGQRPYQGRRLPLHQISSGANDGIRTRTSRLGRPVGDRYPTFASGSAHGYRTRPSTLCNVGCTPPHSGRTRTGVVHRPIDIRQLSKTPLFRAGGQQGIRTQSLPSRRTGLRPVSGPSARTARLATAPGLEPGPASFGGSDAPVTPRCPRLDRLEDTTSQ
jgi:hypothetical protein